MSFNAMLQHGKLGEGIVAKWLISKGFAVLPAYEKEIHEGEVKGPQLYSARGQLVAPDLFAIHGDRFLWAEAKTKSAFTWYRIGERWVTGIDTRHYLDYIQVQSVTGVPVWLFFLHLQGRAKDTPDGMTSPTGLFGGTLAELVKNESHRWESRMVYWADTSLARLAVLEDLKRFGAIPAPIPVKPQASQARPGFENVQF